MQCYQLNSLARPLSRPNLVFYSELCNATVATVDYNVTFANHQPGLSGGGGCKKFEYESVCTGGVSCPVTCLQYSYEQLADHSMWTASADKTISLARRCPLGVRPSKGHY